MAAWLPESLSVEHRVRHGLGEVLQGYGRLFGDRRFRAFTLAAGFASGLIFAYITGASEVLMGVYGVSPQRFGLFFGSNALGLIAGSQVNRRLLKTWTSAEIVGGVYHVTAGASLLLLVHGLTGWGGLPVLAVLLFILLSTMGLVFPNVSALAMAPFTRQAGSASALLGTMQYLIGCAAGGLVSVFQDGTARPMTVLMAASGVIGWVLVRRALRRA